MSDDELVRRYLLGDLPGDEQEALEKRLLSEDDLFELAEALEAEVLEDYARGDLAPEQEARVARYLAVSQEGRLRLAVLRGLAAATTPAGRLLSFPLPAEVERPQVRAAALAAMLVIFAGSFLLMRWEIPPIQEAQHRIPLESPIPLPTPTPPLPPDRIAEKPAAPPAPIVFGVAIAVPLLRGDEEISSFDIPPHTDIVELRLDLPAGDEGYASYRIVLNDAAEREVTKSEDLRLRLSGGRIALQVDADRLPAGRYSLTVQGITPEGDVEDLAFPEFEVHEPQPL